jgi:outer membrane protein assembly factor BamB/serine/threonine protein kinase
VPLASLGPGSGIAGYLIEAELGRGGMGTVFYARHEATGQTVALKVISVDRAGDPGVRDRFLREARELGALRHPHVIPVHGAGNADGVLYIATRYVPSGDLAALLDRNGGPLPAGRAVALIEQVASALDVAHAAGRVHRDVKPGNILVEVRPGPRDHAYLSDFGLVKVAGATKFTATGTVAGGTPSYIAPEQARYSEVDGRADQYSLACVAFELLTGQVPYPRFTDSLVYEAHRSAPVPPASAINPAVPPAADQVLRKAMAKRPEDRYGSCREFAADLGTALTPPRYTPTRTAGQAPTATAPPTPRHPAQTRRPQPAAPRHPAQTRQPEPAAPRPQPVPAPRRQRRTGLIAAGITAALALAAVIFIIPKVDHSSSNDGNTASTGVTTTLRWSFTPPGSFITNPAVAGDAIYVGTSDGKVYALNGGTGSQLWSSSLAGSSSGLGLSRPAVADAAVYVASEDGKVYALNAVTGGQLWSYSTDGTGFSNPVVTDGTVYIGSNDGNVYALNAATGRPRWASPIEAKSSSTYGFSGPAVADGSVYVGSDNDTVYALNAATGSVRWTRRTGGAVNSYPVVAGDTVYIGSEDTKIYALNAATGSVRWTRLTGGYVDSSPTVAGATVYVGSDDAKVYALNAATGSVRWTRLTGGSVLSGPTVTDGTVYVGSNDGNWYALDAATGSVRWAYPTDAYASTDPAVADGIVYVSGPEQGLYALDAAK